MPLPCLSHARGIRFFDFVGRLDQYRIACSGLIEGDEGIVAKREDRWHIIAGFVNRATYGSDWAMSRHIEVGTFGHGPAFAAFARLLNEFAGGQMSKCRVDGPALVMVE